MPTIHFVVPIATKAMNNSREHWATRAKRVKRERGATKVAWLGVGEPSPPPAQLFRITFIRVAPRSLDPKDNLPSSLKAVRDEMAEILGVKDDISSAKLWEYEQKKPPNPKQSWIEVKVEWFPF